MASVVGQPWRRPVNGTSPSSPKNVHCLSGGVENVDNKRQNLGKPPSPPQSSSPTCPPAKDIDSDSSEGSIPDTPPRLTPSSTTRFNVGSDADAKGRADSLSSSIASAVLPPVGDTAVRKTQVRQRLTVERDSNDAHENTRGLLSDTPSPQHAGGSRDNGAADNMMRITLPSLDIPRYRTHSSTQALAHNTRSPDSTPSTRSCSNSNADSVRRASFASERAGWSTSPPTSMPPPPIPSQPYTSQVDSYPPRIAERPSGVPRANPLSVSELIHREAPGTDPRPTPRTQAADGDRLPSLADEFMEIMNLQERVSDENIPKFLEELNHQLSLTGLLREARELICSSFELGDRQRTAFTTNTRVMLRAESETTRDMREVIARAVVGMSRRQMSRFEDEVGHMLDGSLHKPASPYREAICCASYASRFPEDQLAELRRQLRRTPVAAFHSSVRRQQQRRPHNNNNNNNNNAAGSTGNQQHQTRTHNLPPPRDCEKVVESRRPGAAKSRKEPPRPANYSLREFPILSSG